MESLCETNIMLGCVNYTSKLKIFLKSIINPLVRTFLPDFINYKQKPNFLFLSFSFSISLSRSDKSLEVVPEKYFTMSLVTVVDEHVLRGFFTCI